MIKNCILLDKSDIQAIIAEHFHVDLNDVIMHVSTVTVTNLSEEGEKYEDVDQYTKRSEEIRDRIKELR